MPFQSLRSRLTIGVVAVLAVVLALGLTFVARDAERDDRRNVDDRLQRTGELLDALATAAVAEEIPEGDKDLDRLLAATRSSLVVSVRDSTLYAAGPKVAGLRPSTLGFATQTLGGRRVRVYSKVLTGDGLGGLSRLQTTTDLGPTEGRVEARQRRLAIVGAVMLLLAGIGTALAAELVLRPLRRLRAHARGVEGEGDLALAVPVAGPKEIRSLAGSFNAMLRRLGRAADERNRALDATRRFAADVGHEIRTPLTSVQAALSTIHRHPDVPADTRAAMIGDALTENRRLVLLLDGLQALARGDANRVEETEVDLASVAAEATDAIRAQHPGTTFQARLPDDAVLVRGWEPGLRALVDNLLRNAGRHGRPDGRVVLDLRPTTGGRGPVLVVEDDGPGIPAEERARLFEPFARAAGTQTPGSGLGLAIVAQQAHHHAATVSIEDAATGGARFVLRMPPVG